MSFNEKLLREFVRRSLREDSLDEGLKWGGGDTGDASGPWKSTGYVVGGPERQTFANTFCPGRSSGDGCVPGDDLLSYLFGIPANAGNAISAAMASIGHVKSGVSNAANLAIDFLLNTSHPSSQGSAAPPDVAQSLFPKTKAMFRGDLATESYERTLLNVMILLEEAGEAAAGQAAEEAAKKAAAQSEDLVDAVMGDLDGITNLVSSIAGSPDISTAMQIWGKVTGDSFDPSVIDTLTSKLTPADSEALGPGGLVNLFTKQLVGPYITDILGAVGKNIAGSMDPSTAGKVGNAINSTISALA